jgi:AcrR family transcriptional regulator
MTKAKPDGRVLRSERSRQLIMDSMNQLIREGNLAPTAQQVAERAEVGIRSVFRHFNGMESLFESMDKAIIETYRDKFRGGNRQGTLEERILHAMERHATAYEFAQPVLDMTKAQMWRFRILKKNYARSQRELRKDLEDWLPELGKLPPLQRELIEAAASYEFWNRLRVHQGLSKAKATKAVVQMLNQIFNKGDQAYVHRRV